MATLFSKKSFALQVFSFWLVSFLMFAPTANILFSAPVRALAVANPPSQGQTLGAGTAICGAAAAAGKIAGYLSASISSLRSVNSTDKESTGGGWADLFQGTKECGATYGAFLDTYLGRAISLAATAALHQLLKAITNQLIQCINSYDPKTGECVSGGKSGLVLDWNAMMADVANVAGARFLNSLTGYNMCSFVPKTKLQIALLSTPEFKTQAECTLDKIVGNIEDFQNDFSKGGWVAWKASLQPNNDAFGVWLSAKNEKLFSEYAAIIQQEKEVTNGFKSTKECLDPKGVDPDSPKCGLSIVRTPSGTVESSVNFAALSPVQSLQDTLTNMYGNLGPFGPFVSAVSNAMLNKLFSTGMNSLLSTITEKDLQSPNPYQDIIDNSTQDSGNFSTAQGNQASANLILTMMQELNKHITDIAKPLYLNLISVATNIKQLQDKIISEFWAQGRWGSAISSITLGPTTIGNKVVTTYKIIHPQVGEATIEKTVTSYDSGETTTYSVLNKRNQIEDINGTITAFTTILNSLTYTQSQINAATGPTQIAYDKITAYLDSWNGTTGNATAKTAMDQAITTAVPLIQKIVPSTSTTLGQLSDEITSFYNDTISESGQASTDQSQNTYQEYLTNVQNIYNNLFSQFSI